MTTQKQKLDTPTFKYVNPFKVKKWAANGKLIGKEGFIPLIFLLIVLVGVMGFSCLVKIKTPYIMTPITVGDEKSDPTVIRLVICIVDFVLGICCAVGSHHLFKRNKIDWAYYIAFFAGAILWQSIGEYLWHFGFIRLETYVSTPILLVLVPLLLFLARKKKIPFAILVVVLSFMANWIGHFLVSAPTAALAKWLSYRITYLIFGCTFGGLFTIYSCYLVFFAAVDQQARLISAIGLYIGIAEIVICIIEALI